MRAGKLLDATGILDQLITDNLGWVPYTQLANLTGRPAISVPLHWTNAGLPLGVQFVGPLGSDGLLLQLAAQLEEAQPWFHRYAELDPVLDRVREPGADSRLCEIPPHSGARPALRRGGLFAICRMRAVSGDGPPRRRRCLRRRSR